MASIEPTHIVSDVQHWLDKLHLKAPRAICGAALAADEPTAEPSEDAPTCSACAAKDAEFQLLPCLVAFAIGALLGLIWTVL